MGEDKGWCPWWKEVCSNGYTETMLKKTKKGCEPIRCRMWRKISGNDPQTGASIDKWDCSFGWGPTLQLEQARVNFSLGGAVESLRNRVSDLGQGLGKMVQILPYFVGNNIVQVESTGKERIEHKEKGTDESSAV